MKISVELPQPIQLKQEDYIDLFLPDSGGIIIKVHGNGTVDYIKDGNNDQHYSLNLMAIAASIQADLH